MRGHLFDWSKTGRAADVFRAGEQEADRVSLAWQEWQECDDGVIVLSGGPPRPAITPLGFGLVVAAFVVFKATIIASLGPEAYSTAIQALERGTVIEQVGAFVMAPDIASQEIASRMAVLPQ